MNKKIKIVSGFALLSVITIVVVTPIVIVSQQNKKAIQKANDELKTILDKLSGKKVIISEGIDVSTKDAFQKAIINALKIDDKIKLSNEQLNKISLVSNLITEINVFKRITLKVNIDKANIKNDVAVNVKIEKSAKAIANEKIKRDKSLFNGFKDFKTNSSKVNKITDNLDIKDLKILTDLNVNPKFIIPTKTTDVTRKYAIITNTTTGIATVTVTFSANDGDDATKTFTISGFRTTDDDLIVKDKAQFDVFNNKILKTRIARINDGTINDKKQLEDLVLDDDNKLSLPPITKGVTRTYTITTDATTGKATVTITFSATNGRDDSTTFIISGFKNTDDDLIAKDKNKFNGFNNKTLKTGMARINDGIINKTQLEKLNLNDNSTLSLPPITQGVKRTYTITTDATTGKATVTITFSATNGIDASTKFTILGFRTTVYESIQKNLNKIWVWNGEALSNLRGEDIYKAFKGKKVIHDKDIIKNKLGISTLNQKRIKNILRLLDNDDIEFRLLPFSKSLKKNMKIPMKDEKGKIVFYDFNYRYPNIFGFLEVRKKSSNNDWNIIYNSFDINQKRFTSININDFNIDNLTKNNFFDEDNLLKLVSRYNSSKDSWRETKVDNKIIKIEVLSNAQKYLRPGFKYQWHDILIRKYWEIALLYNDVLSYKAVYDVFLWNQVGTFMTFYKENNKLYGKFLMKVSRKGIKNGDYEYLFQNIYFEIV